MVCANVRSCVVAVMLGMAAGCQGLRDGVPDDPLFVARPPMTSQATNAPPTALAYSEPEPPSAPLEMQERPSLARQTRPVPMPALRPPGAPDITQSPSKVPAILTNRPKKSDVE